MDKPYQSPITHPLMRAKKRLQSEYDKYMNSTPNSIISKLREDLLEWHFLFIGLKGTPFEGGEYHGALSFREDYPFSPPSIRFITPNGRFKVNERLSFEFSDLHPELWKPAYTVSGMLEGVYCFMMNETTDTVGSLSWDENEIRSFAGKSKYFNLNDSLFCELFGEKLVHPNSTDSQIEVANSSEIVNTKSNGLGTIFIVGIEGKSRSVIMAKSKIMNYTVSDLKNELVKKTGIGEEHQRLMFVGKELEVKRNERTMTMSDYNIGSGSTIMMEIHCRLLGLTEKSYL